MHETAIAVSIVEIAERYSRENGNLPVERIHLRLGTFTNIVTEALQFAFEAVSAGTVVESAVLDVESVPTTGVCASCGTVAGVTIADLILLCPNCGAGLEIVSGREMEVDYLELREAEPCALPNG